MQKGKVTSTNIQPNQRFGRLVVIGEVDRNKWGQRQYHCRCDCGKTKYVVGYRLASGNQVSCGCKRFDDHIKWSRYIFQHRNNA